MKQIHFSLYKNKNKIIDKNIKVIDSNNKLIFKIENTRYSYKDKIFIINNGQEKIKMDFNNNICNIKLIQEECVLDIKINTIFFEESNKLICIKYKVETEKNITNTIKIEYI